jgi:competence protein ComEA
MRKWLNIDLSFSKREFNGVMVLLFVIAMTAAAPLVCEFIFPEEDNYPADRVAIAKLVLIEAKRKKAYFRKSHKRREENLFSFDPNHTSTAQWEALGLSARQAKVMTNYVGKGGRFRNKEDLQKMFVISPARYSALLPYIHIKDPGKRDTSFSKSGFPHKRTPVMVDLNLADTIELDKITGVGPAFARRIYKYRERVGGFYKKEQLLEVYGLDSVKYKEISGQVTVGRQPLTMIRINNITFENLSRNPYLKFKEANAIIQFRKQHGNYGNIADLKKVAILSAETVDKLAPYLSFEQ